VVTANFFKKVEGILLLLEAFQLISERESDVTFLMVAKNNEPSVIDQIRKYLQSLPNADRIQVVVNRQDVPDLLAAAHLFMYATPPDSSDSLPRVLLEAQAAGVPTVVTNTTGCAEVVLNNKTGRVVQYESDALAEAALVLIRDREEALGLAKEGKRLVRNRFQWDIMAKSYEELFFRVSGISG
jgi:glycosyltransferase involved in cell wall biosynthesis